MARDVPHAEGIVDWVHPLDRRYKDLNKPELGWTCEDDALAFDLQVLTGADFMRIERLRGQLAQEGQNVMARTQLVTRDICETYVKRCYYYSVPITEAGRKLAAELFGLSFPVDQERYRPKDGKELWIAVTIAPGMEYSIVLDPLVLALQNASRLSEGARKKSPSQSDSSSGGTETPKDSAAAGASEPKPVARTFPRLNGGALETATG